MTMTNLAQLQMTSMQNSATAETSTQQSAADSSNPFSAIIEQMIRGTQDSADAQDDALASLGANSQTKEQLETLLALGAGGLLMQQGQNTDILSLLQTMTAQNTTQTADNGLSALSTLMGQNTLAGAQNITPVSQDMLKALMLLSKQSDNAVQTATDSMQAAATQASAEETAMAFPDLTAQTASQNPTAAVDGVTGQPVAGQAKAEPMVQITMATSSEASTKTDTSGSDGQESDFSQLMQGAVTGAAQAKEKAKLQQEAVQVMPQEKQPEPMHALSETQMAKAEAMAKEPEMLQQLEKGVDTVLSTGKQELTMKLNPESLGEVTVRLAEQDGKMTLDITAANAKTAKLINEDIAALREAVRPMNVEVHEAVQHSESTGSGNTQYSQFSQQFSNQHFANHQAWQQQQHSHRAQNESYAEEAEQAAIEIATPTGALNTYI